MDLAFFTVVEPMLVMAGCRLVFSPTMKRKYNWNKTFHNCRFKSEISAHTENTKPHISRKYKYKSKYCKKNQHKFNKYANIMRFYCFHKKQKEHIKPSIVSVSLKQVAKQSILSLYLRLTCVICAQNGKPNGCDL